MDLISEVLSSASEVELSALSQKINDFKLEIINTKEEAKDYLEIHYVKKLPLITSEKCSCKIEDLVMQGQEITNEIDDMMKKYVNSFRNDIEKSYKELLTLTNSSVFLKNTSDLDGLLKSCEEDMKFNLGLEDRLSVANKLVKVKRLLSIRESDEEELVDIYKGFNLSYTKLMGRVWRESKENWDKCLSFKVLDVVKREKSVCLSLTSHSDLDILFKTHCAIDSNLTCVNSFSAFLLKEIIKPIVLYGSAIKIVDLTTSIVLSLDYKSKLVKNNFDFVINQLTTLFKFLNNYFDLRCDDIGDDNKDKSVVTVKAGGGPGGSVSFLTQVGNKVGDEFIKMLIDEQVIERIPLKRDSLGSYAKVVQQLSSFEKLLFDKGFLVDENLLLNEYCGDIEEQFKAKQSSRFLDTAKALIKKDLHDMISVGPIPFDEAGEETTLDTSFYSEDEKHKYIFPKCQISKCIIELVSVVKDCLLEAATASDYSLSLTLLNTARTIFTVYTILVVKHHRQLLDTIPQQSVLLYNNGMYLCLSILQLEKELRTKFNKDSPAYQTTFLSDLITQINTMSNDELNRQIDNQNNIIKQLLTTSGLEKLSELEFFPQTIDKSVRQCLRQLMLLQTVWKDVLPINIYNKIMGMLCNTFVDEFVGLIASATDIREVIANQLVQTIKIISDKAPQVFPEAREIHRWVKSWIKLEEVSRLLGGRLVDVSERWAAGSGPLALCFTPEQVQNMVKALFQNSNQRAQLIASIN